MPSIHKKMKEDTTEYITGISGEKVTICKGKILFLPQEEEVMGQSLC